MSPRYWRHYKGNVYEVLSMRGKNEKGEQCVLYAPCYETADDFYVQPIDRFFGTVEHEGKKVDRFRPV